MKPFFDETEVNYEFGGQMSLIPIMEILLFTLPRWWSRAEIKLEWEPRGRNTNKHTNASYQCNTKYHHWEFSRKCCSKRQIIWEDMRRMHKLNCWRAPLRKRQRSWHCGKFLNMALNTQGWFFLVFSSLDLVF